MKEVLMANPYTSRTDLGSLGNAEYVLIRQHNFPHFYNDSDVVLSADHDRCLMWDRRHALDCCQRHMGNGELYIQTFVSTASPSVVLDFLKDLLKANPEKNWTGWRVMGTVNRSNGYPVYSLQLFANNSGVEVYSSQSAPNVRNSDKMVHDWGFCWDEPWGAH